MKIKIDNDKYIIYLKNSNMKFDTKNEEDIKNKIKEIVINIRNKRKINISGFYKVKVYQNEHYGLIIEMIKEDDIEFLRDFCDLKVIFFNNSKMLLKVDDYFLIKKANNIYYYNNYFYTDIESMKNIDMLTLSEFSEIIYGEDRIKLTSHLKKIK